MVLFSAVDEQEGGGKVFQLFFLLFSIKSTHKKTVAGTSGNNKRLGGPGRREPGG